MDNALLEQLGTKIDQLLDEMELLRMEVGELRAERDSLTVERDNLLSNQTDSTDRIKALLGRFDNLDAA